MTNRPPSSRLFTLRITLSLLVAGLSGAACAADKDPANVRFARDIAPILKSKCMGCHGAEEAKAELSLASPRGIRKGGESGPVLAAGKPTESLLFEMVEKGLMPPKKKDRLSKEQVELFRRWIEAGAPFDASAKRSIPVEDDVVPILLLRCVACHGAQKKEAGLDLRSARSILKGGKSGPAVVIGKPAESLLIKKIKAGQMPPRRRLVEASVKPIQPHEVKLLEQWIAAGAHSDSAIADRSHATSKPAPFWSFQPAVAVPPPTVEHRDQVRNPIDAFLLDRLERQGLALSHSADPLTLMRRAYFDLTGLPPTAEEVLAYEREAQADPESAYSRLIDRLLASPRYGERWARYWLDLAGYADSEGVQHDDTVRANAWRYRDYVIRAFNSDKPYSRFLLEQIAGDELADYRQAKKISQEIYDNLVATGFLRMAPDGTWANITNFVPDRLDVIGDEMEILSSSVMGLTFKCAKCHSHKFDPITQHDYYRLLAVFKGAFDEHNWLKPLHTSRFSSGPFGTRWLPYVTSRERNEWQANEKRITTRVAALKDTLKKRRNQIPADDFKKLESQTNGRVKTLEAQRRREPMIRALWDRGDPSPTYLLRRGNYLTPGERVQPGVPSFLSGGHSFTVPTVDRTNEKPTTGRRLAFARWLVSPKHPLTSRVMVNRIWKHHFQNGIVGTLDNFGKTGARPTHPRLLDWLAIEFVRTGWSVKAMHRLIMTSTAYRQSSQITAAHERLDPDNRLLSRSPLRRLDAESLRDTLLSIAGRLDIRPFGPADAVKMRADGLVTSVESPAGWRRSIFVLQRRTQVPTILDNFDLPQMGPNCVERSPSTVAPQALHLMNNAMIHQLSRQFARRVRRGGNDSESRIEWAYLTALSRKPTREERIVGRAALKRLQAAWEDRLTAEKKHPAGSQAMRDQAALLALANLGHALMNSASLLYVD